MPVSFEIPKDGGHAFVELVPTAFGGSVPKCGLCGKRRRRLWWPPARKPACCPMNPNAATTPDTRGPDGA